MISQDLNPSLAWRRILSWGAAVVLALGTIAPASATEKFLDPEIAFKLSGRALDAQRIELKFEVAPGYHLYRDKLQVQAQPSNVTLGEVQIPRGTVEFDPTFQKDVEIFKSDMVMVVPLSQAPTQAFKLVVGNQGCADKGLCYPPMERSFKVEAGSAGAGGTGGLQLALLTEAQSAAWDTAPAAATAATAVVPPDAGVAPASPTKAGSNEATSGFAGALQSRSLLKVAGVFLLAGLLLSFTPCVLPMIPILSSIIVGQKGEVSKARGFSLALAYSLGMALVYTAFGMAAGLAGEGLAAALQNAWVLGAFAILLAGLSLSMFGVYELQMPNSIQSRITQWSGKLEGGEHVGVFIMGGMSALIVGPCVAAPLAGALVYISQTRDVVLGGMALFAMAAGMSVPLLLVGLSAGSLLPRAGGWMEQVKHFFGVMLLGVALWMVSPVIPSWALMLGVAVLLLGTAVYLGAFERLADAVTPRRALTKGAGLMLAVLATLQLAGVASGGRDLMQPLNHLAMGQGGAVLAHASTEPKFKTVANLTELEAAVRASSKPVMVDFYADWCVACKELETLTFSDAEVRSRMAKMTLLRVDVTANNAADKALMRKYSLFGPPALLFFPPAGEEIDSARVIGFQNAREFREHLDGVGGQSAVKVSLN
jgi:thioredoxin:protein disulfide reductase